MSQNAKKGKLFKAAVKFLPSFWERKKRKKNEEKRKVPCLGFRQLLFLLFRVPVSSSFGCPSRI